MSSLLASYGILWHPMASYGILSHPMPSYGIPWHPIASYAILCHPMPSHDLASVVHPGPAARWRTGGSTPAPWA